MRQLDQALRRAQKNVTASMAAIQAAGDRFSLALSLPLAALGGGFLQAAGQAESMRKAMETTMKAAGYSIAEAHAELEALRKAAMAPGLDFQQAVQGSIRLQNVGFSASKAREILVQLANAVSMTGGSAQELDSVTRQFGQMLAKGRILQEDLTIIQENMPAISEAMEKAFGTRSADRLRAMGISAEAFVDGVTKQLAQLPRVEGGISNSFVNLTTSVKQFAATMGESLNRTFAITDKLDAVAAMLGSVAEKFNSLSPEVQAAVGAVGLFALTLGPALKLSGMFGAAVVSLTASFKRMGTAMTAMQASGFLAWWKGLDFAVKASILGKVLAVTLALSTAFLAVSSAMAKTSAAARAVSDAKAEIAKEAAGEVAALRQNIEVLQSNTAGYDAKKKAVDALLQQYPEQLQGMNLEKASTAELAALQERLTASIMRGVAERKKAAAVGSILEKQAEKILRVSQLEGGAGVTVGESTKVSGGDLGGDFSPSGVRRAVIRKMRAEIQELGQAANSTASEFDKAFGLQTQTKIGQTSVVITDQRAAYEAMHDTLKSGGVEAQAIIEQSAALHRLGWQETEKQKKAVDELEVAYGGFGRTIAQTFKEFTKLGAVQSYFATMRPLQGGATAIGGQAKTQHGIELGAVESLTAGSDRLAGISSAFANIQSEALNMATTVNTAFAAMEQGFTTFGQTFDTVSKVVSASGSFMADMMLTVTGSIMQSAQQGALSLGEMGRAALLAAMDFVKAKAAEAVATAIADSMKKSGHPLAGLILGGVAAAGVMALMNAMMSQVKAPALADGGLSFGPTLAMVGDNPGARVDPEVIAPLSKLRHMMGGGNNQPTFNIIQTIRNGQLAVLVEKGRRDNRRAF